MCQKLTKIKILDYLYIHLGVQKKKFRGRPVYNAEGLTETRNHISEDANQTNQEASGEPKKDIEHSSKTRNVSIIFVT